MPPGRGWWGIQADTKPGLRHSQGGGGGGGRAGGSTPKGGRLPRCTAVRGSASEALGGSARRTRAVCQGTRCSPPHSSSSCSRGTVRRCPTPAASCASLPRSRRRQHCRRRQFPPAQIRFAQMDCIVCLEPFDHDQHRPKVLPCGHSLCLQCLLNPLFRNKCPSDNKIFTIQPAELPDNFTVLNILEAEKSSSAAAPPPPDPVCCLTCRGPLREGCASRRHTVCPAEELRKLRAEEVALVDQRLEWGAVALGQSVRQLELVLQQLQLSQRQQRDKLQQLKDARRELMEAAQQDHGVGEALRAAEPWAALAGQLELKLQKLRPVASRALLQHIVTGPIALESDA